MFFEISQNRFAVLQKTAPAPITPSAKRKGKRKSRRSERQGEKIKKQSTEKMNEKEPEQPFQLSKKVPTQQTQRQQTSRKVLIEDNNDYVPTSKWYLTLEITSDYVRHDVRYHSK